MSIQDDILELGNSLTNSLINSENTKRIEQTTDNDLINSRYLTKILDNTEIPSLQADDEFVNKELKYTKHCSIDYILNSMYHLHDQFNLLQHSNELHDTIKEFNVYQFIEDYVRRRLSLRLDVSYDKLLLIDKFIKRFDIKITPTIESILTIIIKYSSNENILSHYNTLLHYIELYTNIHECKILDSYIVKSNINPLQHRIIKELNIRIERLIASIYGKHIIMDTTKQKYQLGIVKICQENQNQ